MECFHDYPWSRLCIKSCPLFGGHPQRPIVQHCRIGGANEYTLSFLEEDSPEVLRFRTCRFGQGKGRRGISAGKTIEDFRLWRPGCIRSEIPAAQQMPSRQQQLPEEEEMQCPYGDVSNAGLYHEAIVNKRDISSDLGCLGSFDAARRGNESMSVL